MRTALIAAMAVILFVAVVDMPTLPGRTIQPKHTQRADNDKAWLDAWHQAFK